MRSHLLLIGLTALAGCHSSTEAPGVFATLSASPPVFASGSPVDLTLTIANTSGADVYVVDPATSCGLQPVRLFDLLRHEIPLVEGDVPCTLALHPPLLLHAGESVTQAFKWWPTIGIGPADGPIYPSPGQYYIRARVRSLEGTELPSELIAFKVSE